MLYCTFGNTENERYFRGSCQIHLWRQIAGGGITEGGKASPSRPQRQRSFSSFPIILDLFAAISQHSILRKEKEGRKEGNPQS